MLNIEPNSYFYYNLVELQKGVIVMRGPNDQENVPEVEEEISIQRLE